MRRGTGIAVIAAAAALGVTAAVFAGAHPGGAGVAGRTTSADGTSTTSSASSTPGTSTPATKAPTTSSTPTGPPPPTGPTTSPPTSPTTGPGRPAVTPAPATPATPASPSSAYTPAQLSGAALTGANLIQLDDFARAGWSTTSLRAMSQPGDGPGLAGTCQAQPLSSLPGGGGAIFGSYLGNVTSAYESAASFSTQQQALEAYAAVVTWFHQCAEGTLPGHLGRRVTVGPDMQVNLDTEFDRALWVRIGGDGFEGTGGVALVGRRVALFYDQDAAPVDRTVNSLMTAVAIRLTA